MKYLNNRDKTELVGLVTIVDQSQLSDTLQKGKLIYEQRCKSIDYLPHSNSYLGNTHTSFICALLTYKSCGATKKKLRFVSKKNTRSESTLQRLITYIIVL